MANNPLNVSGIYVILHVESGRVYVGSATRINRRWESHTHLLRCGRHYSKHLQNAWIKYGAEAFLFKIIEHVSDKDMLLQREQFWIDRHNAADHETGFNSVAKAGSQIGYKHTPEARLKMSLARKGKGMTIEALEKIRESLKGKPKSPEHVAKVAAALLGKKASSAARKALSAAWVRRKKVGVSEETREKMRTSMRGKNRDPRAHVLGWETRRKNKLLACR